MSKKFIVASALIILGAAAFFFSRNQAWEIKKPSAGQNIIVFGDSLVEGVGSTQGKDFVSLVSKKLGQPVINAGFSGDTTVTALRRLDDEVLNKNPKIVVVLLGGNDFLQRIPKEQTLSNLRSIISQIQAKGAGTVLVGVRKIIYSSEYKRIAEATGSVYVPNILDETYGNKNLMSDQIHPNDAGYAIFAEKISPAIKKLLN